MRRCGRVGIDEKTSDFVTKSSIYGIIVLRRYRCYCMIFD